MPCAHRLNAVASVHVLASSPEIGTKFPEVFFPDHLLALGGRVQLAARLLYR
jgi:hypothetical protein